MRKLCLFHELLQFAYSNARTLPANAGIETKEHRDDVLANHPKVLHLPIAASLPPLPTKQCEQANCPLKVWVPAWIYLLWR